MNPQYIDVIVPLPLCNTYTYLLPPEWGGRVQPGCRVVVSFGARKFYTGIVVCLHDRRPEGFEVKEAAALLDEQPVVLPSQLRFWQWLADYYLCTLGDVYKAALPTGLKIESETIVACNPGFEADSPFTPREQRLYDLLTEKGERVTQLEKDSGIKDILGVANSLLNKGAIVVKETLKQTYRPKTEMRVRLGPAATGEHLLNIVMNGMQRRSSRQLHVLMKYLELSGIYGKAPAAEVTKVELLRTSGESAAVLRALTDRHVLELYSCEVGRLPAAAEMPGGRLLPLSVHQQRAHDEIVQCFLQKNVCLLHGVTSAGKTEIYIHLIDEAVQRGKQVLYLLPEIALTTQITERLRHVFGNRLGVYHSKFPDADRVEIWRKQLSVTPYDIILGVRSSVFLPFHRLGLVIVDEEHETSFKQQDPAPRYYARNAVLVLAAQCGAKALLGTATPSIETWHNAVTGKYGLVELTERYREMQLPEIIPVDIKELYRKKRMNGLFSPLLLQCVREALEQHEQAILFQNRRGFAPMVECRTCGWVPRCANCDVSLTYHKGLNQLTCHYCGAVYRLPLQCPACGGTDLRHRGFGTEKIEDDIRALFPQARVARMDLDTTRSRTSYERIIADFEQQRTDILIGTQMVSKGLDFDHVSVVGILNADSMLSYPDFRAYERAFQLMAQVAGRAGRKNKRGRVVLQTRSIEHPIIGQVMHNDYAGMVATQLAERKLFRYPPYYRLIYVYLKHRNESQLEQAAQAMGDCLRALFGNRVLGPDKPPVARVQTLFIRKLMVKMETGASARQVRRYLLQAQGELAADERFKSVLVYYDVDPV